MGKEGFRLLQFAGAEETFAQHGQGAFEERVAGRGRAKRFEFGGGGGVVAQKKAGVAGPVVRFDDALTFGVPLHKVAQDGPAVFVFFAVEPGQAKVVAGALGVGVIWCGFEEALKGLRGQLPAALVVEADGELVVFERVGSGGRGRPREQQTEKDDPEGPDASRRACRGGREDD